MDAWCNAEKPDGRILDISYIVSRLNTMPLFPVDYHSPPEGTASDGTEDEAFPTLDDPPTVGLSLVIPAFEEEKRLPKMLDPTLAYLQDWRAREP
jgi:hypothetical protein